MNRTSLRNYIERAFDYSALEDAFLEAISGLIDYEEIARDLLDNHAAEIAEIIADLADEAL